MISWIGVNWLEWGVLKLNGFGMECKCLECPGIGLNRLKETGNCWKGLEKVRTGWNRVKYAGIGLNWMEYAGICWNWLEYA